MKTMKQCMRSMTVILAVFLSVILFVMPVAADEGAVLLHNCDNTGGWNPVSASLRTDSTEKTEGAAALLWTVKGDFWLTRNWSTPVNAGSANAICFDLYIESMDKLAEAGMSSFQFELCSGGRQDAEEVEWSLGSLDLQDGWNAITLYLPENGGCDYSRINFVRFYTLGTGGAIQLTYGLDNMRLVYVEPPQADLEDHVIGEVDADRATPAEKEITVNTPYDPWLVETSEEAPNPDQTPDAQEPQSASPKSVGLSIVAILLLALGGAAVVGGLIGFLTVRNKKMTLIVAGVALVLLLAGMIVLLVAPDATPTPDLPSDGSTDVPAPTDSFFTTDQTGHPEVSAADANVEELLKVDPNYSTKNDYKVFFESTTLLKDFSALPHITFHENSFDTAGITMTTDSGKQPAFLNLKQLDCWLLDYWEDTAEFSLVMNEATAADYSGTEFSLNFVLYVTQTLKMTLTYTDTSGEEQALVVQEDMLKQWTTTAIPLSNVDLTREIHVSCKGADIVRLHAVYLDASVTEKTNQVGLIHSRFDTSFYVVAEANVKDYGAKGDGYNDDTATFKKAIDYVSSLGGGTVFVPAGYYCLTEAIDLPAGVGLVGELEKGTVNGTVLCIYGGKGTTDLTHGAIRMGMQSAVMNMAFWYPEQTFVNGAPIPYPATLVQTHSESVTIRNVTFVNSYFGIHFGAGGNNSLQYVRDVYGTCLNTCYYNNLSLDIGRLENANFSPDYWLASGLPGTPNASLLRTYMLRNSQGLWLQRIDWTYLTDITIEGYNKGIVYNASESGAANGHLYNINLLDCYYGIYGEQLSWLIMSNSTITATGGDGATAIYLPTSNEGTITLSYCTLSSEGANALVNYGLGKLALNNCSVESGSASTYINAYHTDDLLINTTLSGNRGDAVLQTISEVPAFNTSFDYGREVVTKPASDAFIHMKNDYDIKTGEDITEKLQAAIDSLKETGGLVYIPAGTYTVSAPIHVWAGIEIRGAIMWPGNGNFTSIHTNVGMDDPDGDALFTLYEGAGLRGFGVIYPEQGSLPIKEYSYTIRGRGAGVYVVAMSLPTSWRGIDFSSYRCDDHYVEYLWAALLDVGISVGAGSENGIIRDCQLTPNTWCLRANDSWWSDAYNIIMERGRPWVIGESKNQILYHNFTYGAREGLSIEDGAENVYVIGHGVDSGYTSAHFAGNCSVYMINSQLVNLYTTASGKTLNYIVTDESFEGEINMISAAFWGTPTSAMVLNGEGTLRMYGAQFHATGSPLCSLNGGSLEMYGSIIGSRTKDYVIKDAAQSLILSGNIYGDGLQIEGDNDALTKVSGTDFKR